MAATVLNTPEATHFSVYAVRAFVQLREIVVSNKELALRLDDLEGRWELLALNHASFEHDARVQMKQMFDALRELMARPEPSRKRPIGFITPEHHGGKPGRARDCNAAD